MWYLRLFLPFECRSALRPRWGSVRLCWECLLGLDRLRARAVSAPVTWAWSLSELLGKSDGERNRALCRGGGAVLSRALALAGHTVLTTGAQMPSLLGGGGAPKGGWAPERGDPPEWGVAALPTTSAGVDSSGRSDVGSAGSAACECQPLGKCLSVSFAGRSAGSAACERQPLGRCSVWVGRTPRSCCWNLKRIRVPFAGRWRGVR